eukprot:SAG11_NODE_727_length_7511_cov_6.485159_4_plen_134_part_00
MIVTARSVAANRDPFRPVVTLRPTVTCLRASAILFAQSCVRVCVGGGGGGGGGGGVLHTTACASEEILPARGSNLSATQVATQCAAIHTWPLHLQVPRSTEQHNATFWTRTSVPRLRFCQAQHRCKTKQNKKC